MLRHFIRGTPGWWVLHLVAILLTLWLGAMTGFAP